MAAAGAILSLGLSWLLGHRLVTQDVSRIPSVLSQRQGGDETARTGLTSHDGELGEIGSSLDEYLTALQLARQAQQREEERRTLLMNEISHRMKNLLSTVQAVASQSFRNGRDTSESLNSFTSRLSAIAKAHQMLMFGEAAGHTTIEQALRSSIAIFDPHRFELSGPDLQLKPRATFSLAIATHELCTNAAKCGALSGHEGRVRITWSVSSYPEAMLRIEWLERNGPSVQHCQYEWPRLTSSTNDHYGPSDRQQFSAGASSSPRAVPCLLGLLLAFCSAQLSPHGESLCSRRVGARSFTRYSLSSEFVRGPAAAAQSGERNFVSSIDM